MKYYNLEFNCISSFELHPCWNIKEAFMALMMFQAVTFRLNLKAVQGLFSIWAVGFWRHILNATQKENDTSDKVSIGCINIFLWKYNYD